MGTSAGMLVVSGLLSASRSPTVLRYSVSVSCRIRRGLGCSAPGPTGITGLPVGPPPGSAGVPPIAPVQPIATNVRHKAVARMTPRYRERRVTVQSGWADPAATVGRNAKAAVPSAPSRPHVPEILADARTNLVRPGGFFVGGAGRRGGAGAERPRSRRRRAAARARGD